MGRLRKDLCCRGNKDRVLHMSQGFHLENFSLSHALCERVTMYACEGKSFFYTFNTFNTLFSVITLRINSSHVCMIKRQYGQNI